jgi:enamine deaminase RidA (YjgF/YER057c/UK114 family)
VIARARVGVGNEWGDTISYSRAVRAGDLIVVSGTTAAMARSADDPGRRAGVLFERIDAALEEPGAMLEDVVKIRMYLKRVGDWEAVGRVHSGVFAGARPATTLLRVGEPISPDLLVEISATAVAAEGAPQ